VTALAAPRRLELSVLASSGLLQIAANATAAMVATIVLGATGRGEMVLGASIGGTCALVGGMGTGQALRSVLPAAAADRRHVLRSYAWCSAAGAVGAAGLSVAACAASAPLLGAALAGPGFLAAVAAFTAGQVIMVQANEAWYADGLFRRGSGWFAACAAGGLAGLLAAAAADPGAAALLGAQAAGSALVCAVQLGRLGRAGLLAGGPPTRSAVRLLLGRGMPALGLTLGLAVALRSDRYVLGAFAGPAAVGVYSLAATLSEVPRVVPQAAGQLFVRHVALGGGRPLARWVSGSVLAAAAGGLLVAAAGSILIVPVFGEQFEPARSLLLVLVVAEACFAPYAVASRGLIGDGRTRAAGAFGLAASIAAVGCYLLGARLGGSTGLAVGCVALYCGLSAGAVVLFRRGVAR
jgi:O-antigen/teichoic acid export membrane protein